MFCLASKMLSPQNMIVIQIVATNVERMFTWVTLPYFGFEYAVFKSCSKSPVTKCSTVCHLQNCALFTLCQGVSWLLLLLMINLQH